MEKLMQVPEQNPLNIIPAIIINSPFAKITANIPAKYISPSYIPVIFCDLFLFIINGSAAEPATPMITNADNTYPAIS